MKSDIMHSRVQLESDVLNRLVTEVKETIATDVNLPERKQAPSFGALSLWNMRRNGRSARRAIKQPRIVTGIGF
jgi:hypothetical protein